MVLVVNGEKGQFYRMDQPIGGEFTVGDEELIWSPDSKAIILTTFLDNEEPTIASVSFVQGTPHVPEDLMVTIQKDFAVRHPKMNCSKEPGVAGLTWLNGSEQAVLVAEVQTVHCEPADGYFEAYVVSIPEGKILRRYTMQQTIDQFKTVLGPGLRDDIELQKDEHVSK